ncbi:MAG: lipopolysaccharide heptosyltransferase II [Anaerolineae bacterium]
MAAAGWQGDPLRVLFRLIRPLFPAKPPRLSEWRSILVLKPCCIGDVLQSTALVAALRQAFPQARLGYAVGAWSRPVLENNPRLDVLVDTGSVVGGRPQDWRSHFSLVRTLRQGEWDACFILERSPLFSLMAWLAGIRDRIGPDSGERGLALTVRVPVRPRRQEAEAYLDLARAVGIKTGEATTEFYPSVADQAQVDHLLGEHSHKSMIVLAPGGGVNPGGALVTKRWPPECFGALAAMLARYGHTVVVIGGPQDHQLAAQVTEDSGGQAYDLCGRLTLPECGALLQRASIFIGNDTGLMHLAAAVGAPVVALFGPTDPAIYAPYTTKQRIIWHPQLCSPCFRQKSRRPECQGECMRSITVAEVEAAALDLLP